jgi:hypothetical protein
LTRLNAILEGSLVISAAIFGWFVADADLRAWWWVPALVVAAAIAGQSALATSGRRNEIRSRLSSLLAIAQVPGDARATYHVPLRFRKGYKQAVDYVPAGSGRGRHFDMDEGIVGRCFVENNQLFVRFEDHVEFEERMVEEFGFSATELARRVQNRRSFMAHPVHDHRLGVTGVVYVDSNDPNALPPENSVAILNVVELLAGEISKL